MSNTEQTEQNMIANFPVSKKSTCERYEFADDYTNNKNVVLNAKSNANVNGKKNNMKQKVVTNIENVTLSLHD